MHWLFRRSRRVWREKDSSIPSSIATFLIETFSTVSPVSRLVTKTAFEFAAAAAAWPIPGMRPLRHLSRLVWSFLSQASRAASRLDESFHTSREASLILALVSSEWQPTNKKRIYYPFTKWIEIYLGKDEPAVGEMLYSGLNRSIQSCSYWIDSNGSQYSLWRRLNLQAKVRVPICPIFFI